MMLTYSSFPLGHSLLLLLVSGDWDVTDGLGWGNLLNIEKSISKLLGKNNVGRRIFLTFCCKACFYCH